ncbi:Inner membrane ABC transporter permease protein ycjO [uncultured Roseburia sp.]|uniref:Sugar ABC transporter permease n=1 Tax=Brotonthovivens ammoniilytica TaxID=2981725 RepID=A0ABT2TNH8_9FIRM|nr:sugar ABC transporter permease [Brotonthovivens ammoniilytica]MCU6763789.1 sugar ABC transporter permease [Brotonthovivens ammoniilytica]SCJ35431.1 Inner membrane ABC transporter permease protein ycjO [uncultured Roseburia sp.]
MKSIGTKTTPYRYLAPTLILMVVFLVVPICMVIGYSFVDKAIVSPDPTFVGWENYKTLFADQEFWGAVSHTIVFVIVSVVAHLVIGMIFAMLLNSRYFKTRTKTVARVIYVLPWVFTASVIAILWKLMLQPSGIVNAVLSFLPQVSQNTEWLSDQSIALAVICFINIWCGYPFYMISILAGLQGISGDLYESAALDGATGAKSFLHITIPQLKPILISIAMLDFIWTLQSFNVVWMLTAGGPVNSTEMLSVYIYKLAFRKADYSMAATTAVVLLIVCVIIAIFYVRQQKKARD